MIRRFLAIAAWCILPLAAAASDDEAAVRDADARYWQAYNACDMRAMGDLLTEDVEFYHDKTGLTVSRAAVLDSLRKGPCSDSNSHLRRQAVDASLRFHPLAGGYALLMGTHRFYVRKQGEPERLDGQAEFANVWQSVDGHWRMRRILSYAHGPVPYTPPAAHIALPPSALAAFAGTYAGGKVGEIRVSVQGDRLHLIAGLLAVTLLPESPTRFFALERDLRFEFAAPADGPRKLTVYENGAAVETAVAR